MARKKRLAQREFDFVKNKDALNFKTIPYEKTLEVSVLLPIDTNWRIYNLKKGIFLVDKSNRKLNYKLSNYQSYIRNNNFLDIKITHRSYTIYSSDLSDISYSFNEDVFLPLGVARNFIYPEFPIFRYLEGLEFKISI